MKVSLIKRRIISAVACTATTALVLTGAITSAQAADADEKSPAPQSQQLDPVAKDSAPVVASAEARALGVDLFGYKGLGISSAEAKALLDSKDAVVSERKSLSDGLNNVKGNLGPLESYLAPVITNILQQNFLKAGLLGQCAVAEGDGSAYATSALLSSQKGLVGLGEKNCIDLKKLQGNNAAEIGIPLGGIIKGVYDTLGESSIDKLLDFAFDNLGTTGTDFIADQVLKNIPGSSFIKPILGSFSGGINSLIKKVVKGSIKPIISALDDLTLGVKLSAIESSVSYDPHAAVSANYKENRENPLQNPQLSHKETGLSLQLFVQGLKTPELSTGINNPISGNEIKLPPISFGEFNIPPSGPLTVGNGADKFVSFTDIVKPLIVKAVSYFSTSPDGNGFVAGIINSVIARIPILGQLQWIYKIARGAIATVLTTIHAEKIAAFLVQLLPEVGMRFRTGESSAVPAGDETLLQADGAKIGFELGVPKSDISKAVWGDNRPDNWDLGDFVIAHSQVQVRPVIQAGVTYDKGRKEIKGKANPNSRITLQLSADKKNFEDVKTQDSMVKANPKTGEFKISVPDTIDSKAVVAVKVFANSDLGKSYARMLDIADAGEQAPLPAAIK